MNLVCYGRLFAVWKSVFSLYTVFPHNLKFHHLGSESTITAFILISLSWFWCSCVKFAFGVRFLQMQHYSIKVWVCLFVDSAIFPSDVGASRCVHCHPSLSAALNSAFTCAVRLSCSWSSTRPFKWLSVLVPGYKHRNRIDLLAVCVGSH